VILLPTAEFAIIVFSVVDRYRCRSGSEFHFDAGPDPDLPQSFIHVGKSDMTFFSQQWTLIFFSIFLIIAIGVIVLKTVKTVNSILKFSGKKYCLALHSVETDTDPDRQAPDENLDPPK
jgi:hypothetical protein